MFEYFICNIFTSQEIMSALRSGFAIVTPASRGLGFALAQQLLAHTSLPVIATARKDCEEVRDRLLEIKNEAPAAEKRLNVLKVDVTGIGSSLT